MLVAEVLVEIIVLATDNKLDGVVQIMAALTVQVVGSVLVVLGYCGSG